MIWDTILQDPDRIKRENPDLFEKIKSVRANTLQESI
jgi:hypothetical protein